MKFNKEKKINWEIFREIDYINNKQSTPWTSIVCKHYSLWRHRNKTQNSQSGAGSVTVNMTTCVEKWKLFTWEITSDGWRSKIIAFGQSHSRYVQAIPPFMLSVNIYHHLKNRSKQDTTVIFKCTYNMNILAFGSQSWSQRQVYRVIFCE